MKHFSPYKTHALAQSQDECCRQGPWVKISADQAAYLFWLWTSMESAKETSWTLGVLGELFPLWKIVSSVGPPHSKGLCSKARALELLQQKLHDFFFKYILYSTSN